MHASKGETYGKAMYPSGSNSTGNTERPEMKQRLSVLLWIRLARICRKYERASSERLRAWDLSLAQFDLLTTLKSSEGITQNELAKRLLVTQGNITQLLDKLEQRGLLARHQEGRTKCLMLIEKGQRLLAEVMPTHAAWNAEQFAGLSLTEQEQLLGLLRKLDRTLSW
jgi:DNA-binding MarR family transcriptional regulator